MDLEVDAILMSAHLGVEKPSADFFAAVATAAGCAPDEIAYVGDRLDNDVLPARRAGMRTVLLRRGPWGYLHAERPDAALADVVTDSLLDLPARIAQLS
jgi:FMN phosphatase YigB (HAD superfamily)